MQFQILIKGGGGIKILVKYSLVIELLNIEFHIFWIIHIFFMFINLLFNAIQLPTAIIIIIIIIQIQIQIKDADSVLVSKTNPYISTV